MKHKGSCAIEADVTKIRPRLVIKRSNRTATIFTSRRLLVIYNRHRFYKLVADGHALRRRVELEECERCGAAKTNKKAGAAVV